MRHKVDKTNKRKSLPSRGGSPKDRWGLNIKVKPKEISLLQPGKVAHSAGWGLNIQGKTRKEYRPHPSPPQLGRENRKVHSPDGGREKTDPEINSG